MKVPPPSPGCVPVCGPPGLVTGGQQPSALTQWDDEEAHVAQPVGCLVRQLLHEEPQDGAEVMLCSGHSDLHRGWWLRIAVTASIPRGVGQRGTDGSLSVQDHPAEGWEAYAPKVQLLLPQNPKGATNPRMPTNRSSEFVRVGS